MAYEVFEFGVPTRIFSGVGASSQVNDLFKTLGAHKVLVITDPGIFDAGVTKSVTDGFANSTTFAVFKDVEPNPSVETIEKATIFCREQACDVLLAVGGGSAIDTAKSVALLMTNPAPITKYEGFNMFSNQPLPLIVIPTTAGTGSEVTRGQVLTDKKRRFKFGIGGIGLAPRYAILDPLVLASLPLAVAATTGMDALTHAIEAFVSRRASLFTDALALKAIELIGQNIRRFAYNPSSIEPAMAMQTGCTLAAVAFTYARVGNTHAMAHPLGGHYDLPHGLANAILLPYVMEFNFPTNLEKFRLIAQALGGNIGNLTSREAALRSVYAIKDLLFDLGISPTLKNTAAKEEGIRPMAEDAIKTGLAATNPRQTTIDDITELYRKAFAGNLQ